MREDSTEWGRVVVNDDWAEYRHTIDRENFAIKIICGWNQPQKCNLWIKHLCGDDQWISLRDNSWQPQRYSQRYLVLPILGSRLNVRNTPGDRPYCSCAWNEQNLTQKPFISWSTVWSTKRNWRSKLECQNQLFWKPSTCCHLLACCHCRSRYREQSRGKGWADTIYINTLPRNFLLKKGVGG